METIEENISFFEWFEENILQICTSTQRSWKTTRRGEVYSKHPPLEEVEFDNYYGEKVKASPFKTIPEGLEKGNPTLKDIKNIQHQNNYSNKILSTISTQLESIEGKISKNSGTLQEQAGSSVPKVDESIPILRPANLDVFTKRISKEEAAMAKIEEKLDRILNPGITHQDSSVNVVNNDDEIQEFEDEILDEVEEPLYNRIERISRRSQNNTSNQKNWYPQPSFPDIQFEEKTLQTQAHYDGLAIYEWNIDGLSDYLIMNVVNEMMMAADAYKLQGQKSNHQIAQVLVTRFTGQLKDWWDKYLDEATRQQILSRYVIRPTTQIIKE